MIYFSLSRGVGMKRAPIHTCSSRWLYPLPLVAAGLMLHCSSNHVRRDRAGTSHPWANAARAARRCYALARSGDWIAFEREAIIPKKVFVDLVAGKPLPWNATPDRFYKAHRSEVAWGFEQTRNRAVGTLSVDEVRPKGQGTMRGAAVYGTYRGREGNRSSIKIKLIWARGRFYIGAIKP